MLLLFSLNLTATTQPDAGGGGSGGKQRKTYYQPKAAPQLPKRLRRILETLRGTKSVEKRVVAEKPTQDNQARAIERKAVDSFLAGKPLAELDGIVKQWGQLIFEAPPANIYDIFMRQIALDILAAEQDEEEAILVLLLA